MDWPGIIGWTFCSITIGITGFSVFNTVRFGRWHKRQMADAERLLRELKALDMRIDAHRLRFALFVAMTSPDTSDDAKNVISTALALAGSQDVDVGHA